MIMNQHEILHQIRLFLFKIYVEGTGLAINIPGGEKRTMQWANSSSETFIQVFSKNIRQGCHRISDRK